MNAKLINPYIISVFNCLETMLGVQPQRQTPYLKDNSLTQGDVTGVIGFADKYVIGSVALSFPTETILSIYNRLLDEAETRLTHQVQDLVGELTNIIAGGAKKGFFQDGISFQISIPAVIVGRNQTIYYQLNTPAIAIPFLLDGSPFILEVTMKTESDRR